MTQFDLYELKQKILDLLQIYFGAVANGPSFTHKFDKLFETEFQKLKEDEHGGPSEQANRG